MKNKKKSQNKSRSNRNKAANQVNSVKAVEKNSLELETETHSSEVELQVKDVQISNAIYSPSEKEDKTNKEEIASTLEKKSIIAENSSNGELVASKEEVHLKEEDTPSQVPKIKDSTSAMPTKSNEKVVKPIATIPIIELTKKEFSKKNPIIEVIKHPLEHNWGFWLNTNENKSDWTKNQKELTVFNTVEDYWCLYHHMKLPSELLIGQDYAIFKQGIKPMWEDNANKVGGKWFINLERKGNEVDRIWLDVVLLMIGENFDNSSVICGAVVNLKQHQKHRVSIWTRNKDESSVMEIGRKLKEILRLNLRLQFIDHKTSKTLYYV